MPHDHSPTHSAHHALQTPPPVSEPAVASADAPPPASVESSPPLPGPISFSPDDLRTVSNGVDAVFLLPLLRQRGRPQKGWGRQIPLPRLALSSVHLKALADAQHCQQEGISWSRLAERRQVATSTLTRPCNEAVARLAIARFLLFRNPRRFHIGELFLDPGDQRTLLQLLTEADVQCDVFDQIKRAPFAPHFPHLMKPSDPGRLSDRDRDLLGRAAQSFTGNRLTALSVQAVRAQLSTLDLAPRLTARDYDSQVEDEAALRLAVARFEELAAQGLARHRETRRS